MNENKLKVILTGATGMVGEGVLTLCLEHSAVENVLVITRRPTKRSHPKMNEIIHADFFDLTSIQSELRGYNACFFCAGVSSLGMNEEDYYRVTHSLTLGFARDLLEVSPDLRFCYVSGAGTDSSEKGRFMWARVKGKTENDLLKLNTATYNFRPAFMSPRKDAKHTPSFYKYIQWMNPTLESLFPKAFCSIDDVGKAMISSSLNGYAKHVLEVSDIKTLSKTL